MKNFSLVIIFILLSTYLSSTSLKEVYDLADGDADYDKVLTLNSGEVYTGSLFIGGYFNQLEALFCDTIGVDVQIIGNGAVLDLQGGFITIQYCANRLDISDCVIINGGVKFRGSTNGTDLIPVGSVHNVTFYKAEDYAVRIHSAGAGISIKDNIFVDTYGTGDDFVNYTSYTLEWLPTGFSIVSSIFIDTYGIPDVKRNWSFFSKPELNAESLYHFALFCDYG